MSEKTTLKTIKDTFEKQNLGVLATYGEDYPYTSLVGFVSDKECRNIIFATLKNTRKHANLEEKPQVSILINSSINNGSDFDDAVSITAFGTALDVEGREEEKIKGIYLKKFPFLEEFINDTSCILVKIEVEKYMLVSHFQKVQEIVLKPVTRLRSKSGTGLG